MNRLFGHACRYCGKHDCPDPDGCDRAYRASEWTWALSVTERNRCDSCGRDRRDGPCPMALLIA